jgi:hypothetical protein
MRAVRMTSEVGIAAALRIQHLRTQISSPWTNGNIEPFWGVLQQEVLDR